MTPCELFDFNALAEAKEMMKAKFGTMVKYYLEDSENYISAISAAVGAGNVEAIIAPSHTLKSSSMQMGALRLSSIAREMEAMARAQSSAGKPDIALYRPLFTQLEATFAETRSGLSSHAA